MKKLLTSLFILLPFVVFAQDNPFDPITFNSQGLVEMSQVNKAENADKAAIYNGLRIWFGENFNNSKAALEIDDKESGLLMARLLLRKYAYQN